jgi:organic radical activating enzyme|tara:strand:+ start:9945 stop:11078 length:1134 start_codon:yes stop_codon:yes gene_type:complete
MSTWCVLPWVHVCVRPNEQIKPCCRFQYSEGDAENAPTLDNFDMSTEFWQQLRSDMLANKPRAECTKCYEQERVLKGHKRSKSLRHWMNSSFPHIDKNTLTDDPDNIRYIEMSIDNLCNFQCRMCDSKFSSQLQKRDAYMGRRVHKKLEPNFTKFDNKDLSNLEYIKLLGGEPFMSPNFGPFLDYLLSKGARFDNIRLQISTNGSKQPRPELLDKLKQFSKIEINVSLDAWHPVNDYQRAGGVYTDVYKNALWYRDQLSNSHVNFHTVVSIYTANYLGTTLKFLMDEQDNDVSVDFVRDPEWQSLNIAPLEYIKWCLEQNSHHEFATKLIENFVNNNQPNPIMWQQAVNNTIKMDQYYNKTLQSVNPGAYYKMMELK